MATALCRKDIRENKLPARVDSSPSRRQALEGADYIINAVRIGGLEGFQTDIEIPLKYGVDQAVGDTLCAGAAFELALPVHAFVVFEPGPGADNVGTDLFESRTGLAQIDDQQGPEGIQGINGSDTGSLRHES